MSSSDDFLKRVFTGQSLEGYIEAGQVITLEQFGQAKSPEIVKTLLATKADETITVGQVQVNEKGDSVVLLCAAGKELLESKCHIREAKGEALWHALKDALLASGYQIKEVELQKPASTDPGDYF